MKFSKYVNDNKLIEWINSSNIVPKMYHDGKLFGGAGRRLYSSNNYWKNFDQLYDFGSGKSFRDIMSISENTFIVGVDNSILKTIDGGNSFTNVLTTDNDGDTFGLRSFTKKTNGELFVATYGTKIPSNTKVYSSVDDGDTWSLQIDLQAEFEGIASDGSHIHGVHVDPYNNDVWLVVGDTPNSSILRCKGNKDTSVVDNWKLLSNPTVKPVEFEGYEGIDWIYHQPIDMWFDEEVAYFSNDNAPWGVKAFNKSNETFFLAIDYKDFNKTPNQQRGTYGLSMGVETDRYLYHGTRPNTIDNHAQLFRMDKTTKVWEVMWNGLPRVEGNHGFSNIFKVGDYLMVVYQYSQSPRIGRINISKHEL